MAGLPLRLFCRCPGDTVLSPRNTFPRWACHCAACRRSDRPGGAEVPPLRADARSTSLLRREGSEPRGGFRQVVRPGVAPILAELATGEPQGHYRDVAGPDPQDLVDMARRTNDARGRTLRLVPTWDPHKTPFGPEMAGDVLLPRADARITPTTFDQWLDQQRTATAGA